MNERTIIKWIPNKKLMPRFYELKYIKDDIHGLTICFENKY